MYVFFWVCPRRQIVVCRRFGTLYQFHLQGLDLALEDGTVRGFRNVGKLQSDAGEIPKRIHTITVRCSQFVEVLTVQPPAAQNRGTFGCAVQVYGLDTYVNFAFWGNIHYI